MRTGLTPPCRRNSQSNQLRRSGLTTQRRSQVPTSGDASDARGFNAEETAEIERIKQIFNKAATQLRNSQTSWKPEWSAVYYGPGEQRQGKSLPHGGAFFKHDRCGAEYTTSNHFAVPCLEIWGEFGCMSSIIASNARELWDLIPWQHHWLDWHLSAIGKTITR